MNLAGVPVSSRTIIVQIYPLLAAGCEVTAQEDRGWVLRRWHSMVMRLRIGNVNRCVDLVQEVWNRRDAYEAEKQERLLRRYTARGVPNSEFMPPSLNASKRKAQTFEAATEDAFFGRGNGAFEDDIRPMKRRVTLDTVNTAMSAPMMNPGPLHSPGGSRRMGDLVVDQLEPEYTVRGKLHWLGAMEDQGWEGMSNPPFCCCGLLLLTHHAVQCFLDDDFLLIDTADAFF